MLSSHCQVTGRCLVAAQSMHTQDSRKMQQLGRLEAKKHRDSVSKYFPSVQGGEGQQQQRLSSPQQVPPRLSRVARAGRSPPPVPAHARQKAAGAGRSSPPPVPAHARGRGRRGPAAAPLRRSRSRPSLRLGDTDICQRNMAGQN